VGVKGQARHASPKLAREGWIEKTMQALTDPVMSLKIQARHQRSQSPPTVYAKSTGRPASEFLHMLPAKTVLCNPQPWCEYSSTRTRVPRPSPAAQTQERGSSFSVVASKSFLRFPVRSNKPQNGWKSLEREKKKSNKIGITK